MFERTIIHDNYHESSTPHPAPGSWPDAGRAWRAKTLWLVRRCWSHPVETELRETGLQTGMALDRAGHSWGSWRRPLRCAGLLDAPWCRWHPRRHGDGNVQDPLEKRILAEQRGL